MKLIEIDKARYRKHLNYVIVTSIAVFIVGSLGIAQTLIALFPSGDGSHFHWNLTGVMVTAIAIGIVLSKFKQHEFMTEVAYIWDLKQVLNQITRRMRKVKLAADNGDVRAMNIMQYSYAGSRLLWKLDDNTIVLDDLAIAQAELDSLASKYNVELNHEAFALPDLKNY